MTGIDSHQEPVLGQACNPPDPLCFCFLGGGVLGIEAASVP